MLWLQGEWWLDRAAYCLKYVSKGQPPFDEADKAFTTPQQKARE